MPTLIVEQPNRRVGGQITSRVLIGRLPTNGIALNDSSASRLHAWVSVDANGYLFVADTGSLTGTFVNGTAITRRRGLADGDVIRVGHTQIAYHNTDDLPPGVEEIDLAGQPPSPNVDEAGVLFDCPCGAPVWFKASAIGHPHQCRQCGRTVRIPDHSDVVAEEVAPPTFVSEPGVRHVPPAATAAQVANDPLLLHEPDAFAAHPHHPDEHGLADSGIHAAATAAETASEPATLTLEQAVAGENSDEAPLDLSGLELPEESPPKADADASFRTTGDVELDFGEAPAALAPAAESHDDLLDLSSAQTAPKADAARCSVCHSAIAASDKQVVCPSCGLTFHEECWKENLGCSAYGCPQVGVLKRNEPAAQSTRPAAVAARPSAIATSADLHAQESGFPWEFVFLFVAVLGALMGAFSYGVPAMIGVLGTLIYLLTLQDAPRRRPVAWAALALCVVGVAAGLYWSHVYWKGWPPIGPWARSGPPPSHVAPGMHP